MKITKHSRSAKQEIPPYTPICPPVPSQPADWSAELAEYPCFVQPKLNGVRAMLSPDGKVYLKSAELRPHLSGQFGTPGAWLDGELWLDGLPLGDIAGLVNRAAADEQTRRLQFWAFDLIHPQIPQDVRILLLNSLIADGKTKYPIKILLSTYCTHPDTAKAEYEEYLAYDGCDGIIYRAARYGYQFGKTAAVLRRKRQLDAEYLCVEVEEGLGKFAGMLGSFQLVDEKGQLFSCGGGNLTVADRQSFWKNPPIGKKLQVRFPYYSAAGIPQCPQFVRVRDNPAV